MRKKTDSIYPSKTVPRTRSIQYLSHTPCLRSVSFYSTRFGCTRIRFFKFRKKGNELFPKAPNCTKGSHKMTFRFLAKCDEIGRNATKWDEIGRNAMKCDELRRNAQNRRRTFAFFYRIAPNCTELHRVAQKAQN